MCLFLILQICRFWTLHLSPTSTFFMFYLTFHPNRSNPSSFQKRLFLTPSTRDRPRGQKCQSQRSFKAPFGNGPVKRRNEAPAIPTRHEKRSLLTSKPQNKLQKQAFWGRMSSMTHTRKLSKYRLFLINYFHIPYPAGKKKQQSNLALPVSIYPQFPPNVAEFDEWPFQVVDQCHPSSCQTSKNVIDVYMTNKRVYSCTYTSESVYICRISMNQRTKTFEDTT